jgi:hypothetical protein
VRPKILFDKIGKKFRGPNPKLGLFSLRAVLLQPARETDKNCQSDTHLC